MHFQNSLAVAALVAYVNAYDTNAPLDKPIWLSDFSGFEPGLESLPSTGATYSQWTDGNIPTNVQQIITDNGAACVTDMDYNPADMITYDVTLDDCSDQPWVFSMHKDSGITIDSLIGQFARMPIQMRQWVRHVITVPDKGEGGHAFNCNGDIVFFRPVDNMVTTMIHETGHSLDLLGAYAGVQLSNSDDFWNNYNADQCTTDTYGATKMIEEVAQTTVIAFYNENVEGQVGGLYGNYSAVLNQYATLITHARDSGNGNSILNPGQNGDCKHNLETSAPTPVVPSAKFRRRSISAATREITKCDMKW